MHSFLDLLSRDLSTASLPCTLGLYHRPTRAWVYGAGDGAPDDFEGDYVLALPGRLLAIRTSVGGAPCSLDLMNAIQDWVVDETQRAWPELHLATGESLAVLSPLRTESGDAVWAADSVRIPVGSLDRWEPQIR